ncbi:hypothetical protein A9Q99_04155 [Gammaproteobacteria bacterium 45_16_T64]|nr:hypothetical protein A9Q99_04155 [Gammaproteobacteria bacterium 45_16_T64]
MSALIAVEELNPEQLFGKPSYSLNSYMLVLKDETNSLTIDQVASEAYQKEFYRDNNAIINLGVTPYTYWLKVSLLYPKNLPNVDIQKRWLLEIGKALLGVAELYVPQDDDSYLVSTSDTRLLFQNKDIVHVNTVFPLSLRLEEEITLYIKIQNTTSALHFPLTLWTPEGFIEKIAREEFLYGLFFGGMLMLMIYNIFVYLSVRDDSYLYYVMYLFGVTLFELFEIGHGVIHSYPLFEVLGKEYTSTIIWFSLWAGMKFTVIFLNIRALHPRINLVCNVYFQLVLICGFISLIKKDHISLIWVIIFSALTFLFILSTSFYSWRKGNEGAKFFFYAWSCNGFGLIVYATVALKILPATWYTIASAPIGVMLEAVVLSFALAERIKRVRQKALDADKMLVDNMSKYRSVFDNALEGMYQMTAFGKIINANKSLARTMGFSDVEKLKNSSTQVANSLFGKKINYDNLIKNGDIRNEVIVERDGFSPAWIINNAKFIRGDTDKEHHIEGTVIDVTDEKEKEIAVNEELKERIKRKIASARAEQKSKFLSTMSHQIRTPLTSIIGFGELMQEPWIEDSERLYCVDMVVENSRELLQLINNILDYSKMDARKFDIEYIVVSTIDIVNSLSNSFLEKAKNKSLDFEINITYPIPDKIKGDPTRILQVVNNLCSNAIRFTEKGKVTVAISWVTDKLTFSVSDTGVGVKKDKLRGLLNGDVTENGGSLGLPISKKLAEMMGGEISISSKEGHGSVVEFSVKSESAKDACWITGPTDTAFQGSDNSGIVERPGQTVLSKNRKKAVVPALFGRVLLAEDNVVNQKLIERVLKKTGVDVVVANDGVEACEFCDNEKFDFVLMDINMPNRNGIEATKHLREHQYEMPIYALTAETDQAEIDRIMNAGCEGVLTKPLNKTHLYEVMKELLPIK